MIYPVGEPERHFWNLEHLEERQRRFRVRVAVAGPVDPDAASLAVTRLTARHPRLRSRYPVVDGEIVREELPPSVVSQPCAEGEVGTRFAITEDPPFRWWTEDDDNGRALVCEVHHVIVDAEAMGTLRRELGAEYALALAGEAGLPDVSPESALAVSPEARERATSYWVDLLQGAQPVSLATRRSCAPGGAVRGLEIEFRLDETTVAALVDVARAARTTVPMLLMAYHVCLLQQCSLADDLALSYAFGNRARQERDVVDNMTVPLFVRIRLDNDDPAVIDIVTAVRDSVLGGIRHRHYSVNDLWDRLTKSPGRASAFPHWSVVLAQHFFNFSSASRSSGRGPRPQPGPPIRTTVVGPTSISTALEMTRSDDVVTGRFLVNDDQMPLAMAQTYMAVFLALCRAGSSALGLRLSDAAARLAPMRDGASAPGPTAVIDGIAVSLPELQHLADRALVGEAGSLSVTVGCRNPDAVTFEVLTDTADPAFVLRFRRRLNGHALGRAYVPLVGRVVLVDRRTGETTSSAAVTPEPGTGRAPEDGIEELLCRLLSDVAGAPVGPDDVYVRAGGSLGDLPRILSGMTGLGLPIRPLFTLFASTPVEVYAQTLRRHMATR